MSPTIETLASETGAALKQRGLRISVAESCTGGGLGYYLTSIPGSSDWFERGFITYSNEAKTELLGVRPETLASAGAVSEQTAQEMAEGALKYSHADISIAITGIAGPDGGTGEKPVGTVWIALAGKNRKTIAWINLFTGDRKSIREATIIESLQKITPFLSLAAT